MGGYEWAQRTKTECELFPADWKLHGKSAGFIRNTQMAAVAQRLIAFPGGKGTDHMIRTAQALKIPVIQPHLMKQFTLSL